MQNWSHDELQNDLAKSRIGNGELILQKLSLGFWGDVGEMDVFTLRLSRTQPRPTCYEIKVSRSDFLSDIRTGKYKKYEPWCERGYFAVPKGLIKKDEIPTGWGLMCRNENGWYSLKQPRHRVIEDQMWRPLCLAIVLKMHPGPWAEPDRETKAQTYSKDGLRTNWNQQLGKEVNEIIKENYQLKQEIGLLKFRASNRK